MLFTNPLAVVGAALALNAAQGPYDSASSEDGDSDSGFVCEMTERSNSNPLTMSNDLIEKILNPKQEEDVVQKEDEDLFGTGSRRSGIHERKLGLKLENTSNTLCIDTEALEHEETFELPLKPHQVQGVSFLLNLERQNLHRKERTAAGGILADHMGFGKTIQAMQVILTNRCNDANFGICKATLVICPLSVMEQWAAEIRKFAPQLDVMQYHGPNKCRNAIPFYSADVVLATYDQVAIEHVVFENADGPVRHLADSPLFHVKWFRVILDEAHIIRNPETKASRGCVSLAKVHGHCLTGTPAQNKIDDLYPIFAFLRIEVFSDWMHFQTFIASPVQYGWIGPFMWLHPVLAKYMLRRTLDTRVDGKPILTLPMRTDELRPCCMTPVQRAFEHYANIHYPGKTFAKLTRLRQICNHPFVARRMLKVSSGDDDELDAFSRLTEKFLEQSDLETLSADGFFDDSSLLLPVLCDDCLGGKDPDAPSERVVKLSQAQKTEVYPKESASKRLFSQLSAHALESGKIREIFAILESVQASAEEEDALEKVLIVSKSKDSLKLLGNLLEKCGVKYLQFDGSLSKAARSDTLNRIEKDTSIQVLLLTLDAGGTGLNITSCNHLILIEPWWNPFVEEQCFGRVHRYGQRKPVFIYRLHCPGTIEDRILEIREEKRVLISYAFCGAGAFPSDEKNESIE